MDRKAIIVVSLCVVLLGLWWAVIEPKLAPPRPATTGNTVTNGAVVGTLTNGSNVSVQLEQAVQMAQSMTRPLVNSNVPEQLLVITNDDVRYTFSSYGGGLKLVEFLGPQVFFHETIPSWRNKRTSTGVASLNTYTPSPTLAILDGAEVQGDGVFTLTNTGVVVRAEKTLTNGLTIVKEFTPTTNYLVDATVRLENHSQKPLALPEQEWTVGTATPMNPDDRGLYGSIGVMWSDADKARDMSGAGYFSTRGFACMPRTPPPEVRAGQTNVTWAAVHNQFFALVVVAKDPAKEVVMRKVDLPELKDETTPMYSSNGFPAALVYPALTLNANSSLQRQFVIYAGPKEYRTLANVASSLNNNLDAVMNFGWFSGFFAKALLLVMNFFHSVLRVPYGWAIVVITVILRVAFWPLTASSTRSMKKMQLLQPQIKGIQEKYKDDPMKVQKKTMELWKENKVNPMGSCLPAVVQMPVFFGFYAMLRSAIELRGAHFLWVPDLSKPDTLFLIPGTGFPFNLLPLLMVGVMLWQSHLQPPSPGMDPGQQRIMRYMPAIFLVWLYSYSSGMALYMFVSTLLGIVQTKMTKMQQTAPATPALTPPPKKKK
ncbi:MAG TPA: membrane protein insertase YidC [Verrucomicrobiae bacterium]|nr:membrane protein insertase YidC [Verrucomicrobiae bacterium]